MKKLILFIAFALVANATETLPLHILPYHDKTVKKADGAHTNHRMKKPKYQLIGCNGESGVDVSFISPSMEKTSVRLQGNVINLPRAKGDNYHAIVANMEDTNTIHSAVYYVYKHGKPSNVSPTKITNMDKAPFEIKPNPLPKEHDEYKSSLEYDFTLTLNAKPISAKVNLKTLNGTIMEVLSDENGKFSIILPNDFKNVKNSRRGTKPSHFILSSSIEETDKSYHTTFSMPYHVNPTDYWKNTPYGFLVAIIGIVFGVFLYRRSKNG